MENWKLPSQLVTTNRQVGETETEMFLRHERSRRVQAEHDLILALDHISVTAEPDVHDEKFLSKFKE